MEPDESNFIVLYKYTKALSVALGYRDHSTRLHSERVLRLSEAMGMCCGLTKKDLGALKISASFHDIGKIGIPDHILLKPARLDETESEEIKQHSEIGHNIMAATELAGSLQVALIIRHHHENYNGTGYPGGLSGEEIPICSRIIRIADSYDAMAVRRSYDHAKTHLDIMATLNEESGAKYDPECMRVFGEIIESSEYKAAAI